MDKFVITLLLLFSMSSCGVFAQKSLHPIELVQQECIMNSYSTAEMNKCTSLATQAWEKEIVGYEKQIKRNISNKQYKMFIASQKSWQKYYEKEKQLIAETIFIKAGTIHTSIANSMIKELAKQRALYLKTYLYNLAE